MEGLFFLGTQIGLFGLMGSLASKSDGWSVFVLVAWPVLAIALGVLTIWAL